MIWRRWVTESSSSATQISSNHLDRRLSNTRMRPPQKRLSSSRLLGCDLFPEAPGYKSGFLSSHWQLGNDAPSSPRFPEAFAIHISVVYDVLPMTCSTVRALPCR